MTMLYLNDTATRAEMSLTTKILTLKVSHTVPDYYYINQKR